MTHNLPALRFNRRMSLVFLQEDMTVDIGGAIITVPEGFRSDGDSIPRWARWAIPKWGPHAWAALVHDWLYWNHRRGCVIMDKRHSDALLMNMAMEDGMHWRTAVVMWLAVRLFARSAWESGE